MLYYNVYDAMFFHTEPWSVMGKIIMPKIHCWINVCCKILPYSAPSVLWLHPVKNYPR